MKKLDKNSQNIVANNAQKLRELFPEAFTESGVNFDTLRQLLGDASIALEEGTEKFGLSWHGKKKARQIALTPTSATLTPCPKESVDWDKTQNLFMEGDNLGVLKVLQRSYANKVKMIYIDPPYNTGKDFIYPNKYDEGLDTYLRYTGQKDESGWTESGDEQEKTGRLHTNWLNMMYPRLRTARELLSKDGFLVVAIDHYELFNLGAVCDEIFGEENRVGIITVYINPKGRQHERFFSASTEHLLVYTKDISNAELVKTTIDEEKSDLFTYTDDNGNYRLDDFMRARSGTTKEEKPNFYYPIYVSPDLKSISSENKHGFTPVYPIKNGKHFTWKTQKNTFIGRNDNKMFVAQREGDVVKIYNKYPEQQVFKNLWTDKKYFPEFQGTQLLKKLFDGVNCFDYPKSLYAVRDIVKILTKEDEIVVDFFAGSCTTAHAIMDINKEDDGNRKYIMVQLPEKLNSKEHTAAYDFCQKIKKPENIAEIGKERIRRAAKKIKEENPDYEGDLGFKVFKLSTSGIKAWKPDKDNIEQTLLDNVDNIKPERTEQDLLYEMLLKRGALLTSPIEVREIARKNLYNIGNGALFACLDKTISRADVEEISNAIIAWHKEINPIPKGQTDPTSSESVIVFRDNAFENDEAKVNMAEILKQNAITHIRSL